MMYVEPLRSDMTAPGSDDTKIGVYRSLSEFDQSMQRMESPASEDQYCLDIGRFAKLQRQDSPAGVRAFDRKARAPEKLNGRRAAAERFRKAGLNHRHSLE